ncbi:Hpt domain-containing protein [Ferrimonas balearica]|uniref:Hpt domain-containing protein n=1 Tax=Ferrimonas balearica TaxID=44012 RepID=UPI001C99E1DB|nr:Hpt domain-containing protein [Ferrimonas balearica]MBY5991621.1 Hpt domain-containing protein [Ferrimonas balearica]
MELLSQLTLDRLAEEVGEALLPDLLSAFVADLTQLSQTLASASDAMPTAELATLAHRIKGSAASFGADALAQSAKALELSARAGPQGDLSAQRHACCRLAEQTLKHYQSHLNALASQA